MDRWIGKKTRFQLIFLILRDSVKSSLPFKSYSWQTNSGKKSKGVQIKTKTNSGMENTSIFCLMVGGARIGVRENHGFLYFGTFRD